MAENTVPIWGKTPKIDSITVTAANTSSSGAGTIATDIFKAATMGANGGYVRMVQWIPTATTPTTTTGTVGRVFKSSVASSTTAATDTFLIWEQTLQAFGAGNATVAVPSYFHVIEQAFPANATVLCTNHAAPAANTAWRLVVYWTDY
jgi:hypothetical protein